jgi:hypothetical protein
MTIDWGAFAVVAIAAVVSSAGVVSLFSLGIKFLSIPPRDVVVTVASARDEENDDVSDPTRPVGATIAGTVCFVLCGLVVLYAIYLIIPAFHN